MFKQLKDRLKNTKGVKKPQGATPSRKRKATVQNPIEDELTEDPAEEEMPAG